MFLQITRKHKNSHKLTQPLGDKTVISTVWSPSLRNHAVVSMPASNTFRLGECSQNPTCEGNSEGLGILEPTHPQGSSVGRGLPSLREARHPFIQALSSPRFSHLLTCPARDIWWSPPRWSPNHPWEGIYEAILAIRILLGIYPYIPENRKEKKILIEIRNVS